ncbi:MAG: hypothetical protein IH586_03130 [Anaerolineaceae bacterium]|nr:hypothetical protein [Anaerolineaceae bacterium]
MKEEKPDQDERKENGFVEQTSSPKGTPSRLGKGPGDRFLNSFTVSLPGTLSPAVDVFDLWQAGGSTAVQDAEIGSVWRADLPLDPRDAFTLLEEREEELRLSQRALPAAGEQLAADLRLVSAPNTGGHSFALSGDDPTSPHGILAMGLQHQDLGVSFGLFDGFKIDPLQLNSAARMTSSFAEQVRRTVDQLALVETTSAGHRLGITRAAWSGDVETWWESGASRDQRLQHEQVLAQALATRQGWLRFLLTAAAGITSVAVALASGPFSPVAIWTTWNYLQAVVKEYKKIPAG